MANIKVFVTGINFFCGRINRWSVCWLRRSRWLTIKFRRNRKKHQAKHGKASCNNLCLKREIVSKIFLARTISCDGPCHRQSRRPLRHGFKLYPMLNRCKTIRLAGKTNAPPTTLATAGWFLQPPLQATFSDLPHALFENASRAIVILNSHCPR